MHYMPHTPADVEAMLEEIGISSIEDLFLDIPEEIRLNRPLKIANGSSELEVWQRMMKLAERNKDAGQYISFLGAGSYQHYQPRAVKHLLSRSEFYTAYTPYQPEISQGTLQSIFEYQTAICELTGMDGANASLYDGATAVSEAAIMAAGATRRREILVSSLLHPEYRETMETYLKGRGIKIITLPHEEGLTNLRALEEKISQETAAIILQQPNFLGSLEDLKSVEELIHSNGALNIAVVDPLSLGILEAPGNLGVDIAVGEGQSLGLPMSFGGPYLGFMAVKEKYLRGMPGRIVGMTEDKKGREGFVLTLQTREQHIRREKAGSNICSNQALCALAALLYLSFQGPRGIEEVGRQCITKVRYAKGRLTELTGISLPFKGPSFKEFVVKSDEAPAVINKRLWGTGILGGLDLGRYYADLENCILLCVTEMRSFQEIDQLAQVWGGLS